MMHADFYLESWLIYLLTSAIFLILFYFLIKLFFKSFYGVYSTWLVFAVALLTPIDNSVEEVIAYAPAVMVVGLSGMDNLFASKPDWAATLDSLIYLSLAIVLSQITLILSRNVWLRIKGNA